MARSLLLLILPLLASGEEYIFWAKYSVSNHVLTTHQIAVSPAMKESNSTNFSYFCDINDPLGEGESKIAYLNRHAEDLAECFEGSQVRVLDASRYESSQTNSKTNITYVPIRFIVDFKDFGVTIKKISEGEE